MNKLEKVIVKQSLEISELKDEIETLESLLKEYKVALQSCISHSKHEASGLLMDVVGRKILYDLACKE